MKCKLFLKPLILFIVSSLLFCHCHRCDDEYTYVPEENKLVYKNGDLLVYKSNTGKSDTFRLEIKNYFNQEEESCGILSMGNKYYFEELINYDFKNVTTGNRVGFVVIEIDNNKSSFDWQNLCGFGYYSYTELYDTIILDNKTYYKVYKDNTFVESCDFKEVFYNQSFGLIQYSLKNGETWTLE